MSIADLDVIDLIATKPGTSDVQLVVSDHWEWDDIPGHCYQLQEKLNAYFAFIEGGELHARADVRQIPNPDICLAVICLYDPPTAAREFFAKVEALVNAEGYRFRFEHRPLQPFN